MPPTKPAVPPEGDLNTQVALMRQAFDYSHKLLIDGQDRIESSVKSLREEVAKTYVDKVEHSKLEGRVKATEDRIVAVDGRVSNLGGYMGWATKSVLALVFAGIATALFVKGGMHP